MKQTGGLHTFIHTLALVAVFFCMLGAGKAHAAPSAFCPTLSATVPHSGSVQINVSTCDGPFDGGMSGPIAPLAQHGTVTIGANGSGTQFVTYTHNGNGATSDQFFLEDNDLGVVTVNITISPPSSAISVSPASLPTLTAGSAFSQTLTSTGGTAPYTYTLDSGVLPPGLSLSSGGVLSGTPTQRGGYTFSVRVDDAAADTTVKAYSGTVQNPSLSIAAGATAVQNVAFSETLAVTGGVAPYAFQIETGSLPSGITLSSGGVLSGTTAVAPGSYPVTIRVTDSSTGPGSYFEVENFTLTVAPLVSVSIASSPIAFAENAGSTFVFTATRSAAFNGVTVVNVTTSSVATSGVDYSGGASTITIPANATTGTLTITPIPDLVAEPDEIVTLTIAAGSGYTVGTPSSAFIIIQNDDAPIAISPATLPNATVAAAYSQTLTSTNGATPYSYSITAGALPAGLTLSAGGVLSGTPTAGGSFNFTVRSTDSTAPPAGPDFNSRAYTLVVAAPTLTLPATTLSAAQINTAYSAPLNAASGGTAPYTYAVTAGALPSGVTLSAAGVVSGTPTASGSFNFTVTATDSSTGTGPYTASRAYSLTVANVPPVANAVAASVAYNASATSVTLNITGGAATSVAVAAAPSHGTAVAAGVGITYQPTSGYSGSDSFTYTASNAAGTSAPATVTITVGTTTLSVTAGGALTATVAQPYTQTFTFAGGAAPYVAPAVSGLPSGLSVTGSTATTITVSGTPTVAGSFSLTVSATDSSTGDGPFAASRGFTLTVAAPALAMTPGAGALSATYASAYSQAFSASGGVGPYAYALSGALPAGVSFNTSSGILSGTPTAASVFPITVTATDTGSSGAGSPFTVSLNYTLTVSGPVIIVTPATLPTGSATAAYSTQLSASGGIGPYTFAVSGGALPSGLTLAANGAVTGTPTVAGVFSFTVTATDANSQSSASNLSLTVAAPALVLNPATLPTATISTAYSQTLTASGGTAPYTYAVTSGALPAGLSLDTVTGEISGTPTAAGTANFDITATDSTGGGAGTVTVSYALQTSTRPSPEQDAEVVGLSDTQIATTQRFGEAQVFNFMDRLTHIFEDRGPERLQMGLRLSMPATCSNPDASAQGRACTNNTLSLAQLFDGQQKALGVAGADAAGVPDGAEETNALANPWTIWTGGTIRFGEVDASASGPAYDFESEGVSVGMDRKFSTDFAAGFGVGAGRETVDIGDNGSRNKSNAKAVAVYGSRAFGDNFYLDALAGHQWLDFDVRRYVNPGLTIDGSNRSGRQWFAALSARAVYEDKGWLLSPYARAQASRATLDAYRENSGTAFDLSYAEQDVDSTALSLGTRMAYRAAVGGYDVVPSLRLEYQHEFERSADARAAYVDTLPGPLTPLATEGSARNQLMIGTGVDVAITPLTNIQLEYMLRHYSQVESDQTLQMMVKHRF